MTFDQFAAKVGIHHSSLVRYENGGMMPKLDKLNKIAKACDVDINYFYDDLSKRKFEKSDPYEIKVVGMVPAGHMDNIYDEPPVLDSFYVPFKEFRKCIAILVDGDSMERLFYRGDVLFIRERDSQYPRKDGLTYVVEWEENEKRMRAIKNVYREKKGFRLVSENRNHRDIFINNILRLYKIVGTFNKEFRYQTAQ